MYEIKKLFLKFRRANPNLSSLISLNNVLLKNKFRKGAVTEAFNLLVDKSDYSRKDRDTLLEQAWELNERG